jgi:hypothetical protein
MTFSLDMQQRRRRMAGLKVDGPGAFQRQGHRRFSGIESVVPGLFTGRPAHSKPAFSKTQLSTATASTEGVRGQSRGLPTWAVRTGEGSGCPVLPIHRRLGSQPHAGDPNSSRPRHQCEPRPNAVVSRPNERRSLERNTARHDVEGFSTGHARPVASRRKPDGSIGRSELAYSGRNPGFLETSQGDLKRDLSPQHFQKKGAEHEADA